MNTNDKSINNIILLHVPDTLNYGSAMMGINFIHYFSLIINNEFIYITHLFNKNDLKRLNIETLNKNYIKKFDIRANIDIKNKIEKFIDIINKIFFQVKYILSFNPIAIVVLGGDDISEYGSLLGLMYNLYLLYKLSKKTNVYLVGQTIGPFYLWRKQLAVHCLKNCIIFSRDCVSTNYLKNNLKLNNVIESSDLAFLDLPRQKSYNNKKLLGKYHLEPNNYITIIPSGLVHQYTKNYSDYLQAWIKTIISLTEIYSLKSKKIVLLAHVLTKDVNDKKIINHIRNKLPQSISNRIVYITDILFPSEARIILGNGFFTITGRMHGAISTFQMLKPAIALSYSVKYEGIISDKLDLGDLVIEAKSDVLWHSGEIVELILEKVNYVLNNYNKIINRIKPAVDKNKNMAMYQIEYIAKHIEMCVK